MKNILVIGATGQIGSELTLELRKRYEMCIRDSCSIGWGWFVLFCLLSVFYAVSDKILSFLFCFSSFISTFAVGIDVYKRQTLYRAQ